MVIIPSITPEFAERLNRRNHSEHQQIWNLLDSVCDPELPGLTIWDLGILQDVKKTSTGWVVEITLTYSGCPAVGVIKEDISAAFIDSGLNDNVTVNVVLSPAWSTDLISPEGKQQLKNLSIAPPVDDATAITCPICQSENTEVVSEFGSTACKALYRCTDCLEPFDYFKQF